MPAQIAASAAGAHDHGHCVPANDRTDAPLHCAIAGHRNLTMGRNRIQVGRGQIERQMRTGTAGHFNQPVQQKMRAFGTLSINDRGQRFQPLARFVRIMIVRIGNLVNHKVFYPIVFLVRSIVATAGS